MNPPQKITETKIQQYANRFFQHNADKYEHFSIRRFRFINYDEDNIPMMDEDGNWQYKEITERTKAFEDWKKFIDKQLKNIIVFWNVW